jgi:DNA-binding beta-propeller fold protein YncE
MMGNRQLIYEVAEGWGKLPEGWSYREVAAVGVDRQDQVYLFSRGDHPIIVYDRDGNFLRSWGEGVFTRAHGLTMGSDDSIYCTDDGDHTVRKCTLDGKILLQLGIPGKPAPYQSGEPFNRCTHVALSPKNEIYVSDGYGNSRVHKYSPGTDPGQFNIVHNICTDDAGYVYVADRENHRIQVFDSNGKYETQWNNMHRPCALYMDRGPSPLCYIGELGPGLATNKNIPNVGHRLIILTAEGKVLARLGDRYAGEDPGQFIAPHGIAVDSHGDIYVGEVSWTIAGQHLSPPKELRSLQKLIKRS